MSEEEKQVLQTFKNGLGLSYAEEEIILNLIDRLQKELEQEKEKNKKLIAGKFREVADKNSYIKDLYVSKDKIKELALEIHNILDKNGMTRMYQVLIDSKFEDLLKEN